MNERIAQQLEDLLGHWEAMKHSDFEDAGDDADRFQTAFYEFTEALRTEISSFATPPGDVEEAREHPQFSPLFAALPDELQIPFETELDSILRGLERRPDATEQS